MDSFKFPSIRKQPGDINEAMMMNGTIKRSGKRGNYAPNRNNKEGRNRKPLPKLKRGASNVESNKEKQNRMQKIREVIANPSFSGKGSLHFYKIGQLIGQGAFGKVYRGWHRISGQELAIKSYPLSALKYSDFRKAVKKETKLLQSVCHPGVIALYEVIQEKGSLYIIMEYASGGSLKGILRKTKNGGEYTEGAIQENDAKRLFHQVAAAVAYLHHEEILHRDLKLENVLLDKDGYCKILDLGFSTVVKEGRRLKERCGTIVYMAPELLEVGTGGYSFPVDIWALGSMLYLMLTGNFPFRPTSIYDMRKNMKRENLKFPRRVSPLAKDLVNQLLRYNENDRLNADQVLMHPWLSAMDEPSPSSRPRTRHLSLMNVGGGQESDSDALREEERAMMSARPARQGQQRPKLQRPMSGGGLPSGGKLKGITGNDYQGGPASPSRFAMQLKESQECLHSPPHATEGDQEKLHFTRPPSRAWGSESEEPNPSQLTVNTSQHTQNPAPEYEDEGPQTNSSLDHRPPRPHSRRGTTGAPRLRTAERKREHRRKSRSHAHGRMSGGHRNPHHHYKGGQGGDACDPALPSRPPSQQRHRTPSPRSNSSGHIVVDDQSLGSHNTAGTEDNVVENPALSKSKNHFDNMEEYFEPYRRCRSGHSAHLAASKLTFPLDHESLALEMGSNNLDLDRILAGERVPVPAKVVAEGEGAELDTRAMDCMAHLGFSENAIRDALFKGERNQLTACYFLLWASFASEVNKAG